MKILKSQGSGNIIKIAKFGALAGLIISSVFIITCSDKKTVDFGKFEAGVYTNSFFDMVLSLPDSWHVLDLESRMEIMKRGSKIVAGDNKRLKTAIDTADQKSLNLLTAYESPPGAAVTTNPGIMLIGPQREFARQLPNQEEVTVKGLHFIQEDSPSEIGEAVAQFVQAHA